MVERGDLYRNDGAERLHPEQYASNEAFLKDVEKGCSPSQADRLKAELPSIIAGGLVGGAIVDLPGAVLGGFSGAKLAEQWEKGNQKICELDQSEQLKFADATKPELSDKELKEALAKEGFNPKPGETAGNLLHAYKAAEAANLQPGNSALGPRQSTDIASRLLEAAGVNVDRTTHAQGLLNQLESTQNGWTVASAAEKKPGYLVFNIKDEGRSRVGVVNEQGGITGFSPLKMKLTDYPSEKFVNESSVYLKPPERK